jgi:hypothetical protein
MGETTVNTAFLILTAASMVGGMPDTPAPVPTPAQTSTACSSCAPSSSCCQEQVGLFARLRARFGGNKCSSGCDCCESRPGLFGWLRGLFNRRGCSTCEAPCNACAPAPAAPPVLKSADIKRPERDPSQISREYVGRVGHNGDYSVITGQLYYVHADKGIWVVRYAPVDREDRYGGSVVLAPIVNMDSHQDGELVTIHGELLNEGRATKYLGGPAYRTTDVATLDRPK